MAFRKLKKIIKRIFSEKGGIALTGVLSEDFKDSLDSYSQEGEDRILERIFDTKTEGFYIDIGAHHPKRFSNTFLFYKKGWRGINIDAMPGSMKAFRAIRPEDINLECAISDKSEELTFYIFNEKALNTFSKIEAQKKDGLRNYKIEKEITLRTHTLSSVLQEYLEPSQEIDFLTIDAEGFDLKVLKSLDWSLHKPKVILVEEYNSGLENLDKLGTYKLLTGLGYKLFAKTVNTFIYQSGQ